MKGLRTYPCLAAAVWIVLISNIIELEVSAVQTLQEGPSDVSVNVDTDAVTLSCVVANRTGDVFWTFGVRIIQTVERSLPSYPRLAIVGDPALGEYNLRISNVQLEDDGEYGCQVTPGLLSDKARLTVRRPPVSVTVDEGPQKTVSVGEPSNLTCTAINANPAVSITWLRDGVPREGALTTSSPSADPSGKLWNTTSVLTVKPTLEDRSAVYECQAINAAITAPISDTITLDVQHAPVIHLETIPADLREGLSIIVQCVVEANPSGVLYQWSKNGEPVPGDTSQYEMELEKSDHGAVVACTAVNAIGVTEGSITLDVKYGPRFVDIPGETSVDEGELAELDCSADGNPLATIKWSRINSRATLSTMQKLQFDSVRKSDVGVYVCEATVEGFDSIKSYGRVDINSVPVIQLADKHEARQGSTARLECLSDSKPVPDTIVWSWGDTVLDQGSSGRYTVTREERDAGVVGILMINKVRHTDFREYNCTMINAKGSAEAFILLEPKGIDLLFYIIILVVSLALLIFVMSIIFMVYCRWKLKRKSSGSSASSEDDDNEKKVKVEIIRKLSDIHLSDEERRKLAGTAEPPRYAEPYIPRRRDSWEDPTYRPLSMGSHTPPYGEDVMDRRFSSRSSHEYMDAGDGPYRGGRLSGIPDRDSRYEGSLDEPYLPSSAPDRDSRYNGSLGEPAPPEGAGDRDPQYEGTLRWDPARPPVAPREGPRPVSNPVDRTLDRRSDQYPRRYSDNRGFGYFAEPARRDPGEMEALVQWDNPNRRSNLSVNSRNKLATNV